MAQIKVLIVPGAFQMVKNYQGYDGIDIWLKKGRDDEKIVNADWIVAHSLGVNYVLSLPDLGSQKFVLINPLIKKRSFINLLFRDVGYIFLEGIGIKKIVPVVNWPYAFKKAFRLAKIDVLEIIKKMSKGNVTIIRGKDDSFFCDKESIDLVKQEGISLIEVDAGHDWNQNIADAVSDIISNKAHQ